MRRIPVAALGIAGMLLTTFASAPPVHAAPFPPTPFVFLGASLSGANEVPAIADPRVGSALVGIDKAKNQICNLSSLTLKGSETVNAQHIHTGAAGATGGVLVPFDTLDSCTTVSADTVTSILANPAGFYFNIHTTTSPTGAARGQLMPVDPQLLTALISSTNEVPPNASGTLGGVAILAVDATNQVCVSIALSGQTIDKVVAMHIHSGGAGVNGPVIIPFTPGKDSCTTGSNDAVSAILANPAGNYFNIHTAANPNGEARGQLDGRLPLPPVMPTPEEPMPAPPAMMVPESSVKPATPVPAKPAFTG
jgi:CHRD domain